MAAAKVVLYRELHPDEEGMIAAGGDHRVNYDLFGNYQYGIMMAAFGVSRDAAIVASNGPPTVAGIADARDDVSIGLRYDAYAEFGVPSREEYEEFLSREQPIALLTATGTYE